MRGRPLGFLAAVAAGWTAARIFLLWPALPIGPAAADEAIIRHDSFLPAAMAAHAEPMIRPIPFAAWPRSSDRPGQDRAVRTAQLADAQILALYGLRYFVELHQPTPPEPGLQPSPALPPPTDAAAAAVSSAARLPSRWSLSAWLIAREGGADPRLAPLLGASQAGVRVSYAVSDDRRLALFGRAATSLSHGEPEIAAGVQWRPGKAPITGFVEARHRAGAGIAPAAGVFGGASIGLPNDFRLDSYGQAGWVGGRAASGFVEGQARVSRVVARIDDAAIDVGGGIWGAAQRGAARLDVGPGTGVTLPLGRGAVRLGLDWRQRVAGHAAPGSGPALTLGAGF